MNNWREMELTCVYDHDSLNQGIIYPKRVFRGIARGFDDWWGYGTELLLNSVDGIHWQDIAGALDLSGSFSVSAVLKNHGGAFVFSRSSDGLLCHQIIRGTRHCKRFPLLPTSSPDALPALVSGVLVVCVEEGGGARFMKFHTPSGRWEWLPSFLSGVPVHFEMNEDGAGLCALWGVERREGVAQPSPSVVYGTRDSGMSWSEIRKMDTMLLCGTSDQNRPTLLGGSDGFIAEGTIKGFKECRKQTRADVVSVCSEYSQQTVLLESSDQFPVHTILWRPKSQEWQSFNLNLRERVLGIEFLDFGTVLLSTQTSIFACRIVPVQ